MGVGRTVKVLVALLAISCTQGARPKAPPLQPSAPACSDEDRRFGEDLLRGLEQEVAALSDDADALRVTEGLDRILTDRCFGMGNENPRHPRFARGVQAKTWWSSGGGSWLASLLQRQAVRIWLPPDVIPLLDPSRVPKGLRDLVCPPEDVVCGLETSGWSLRADEAWKASAPDNWNDLERCRREASVDSPTRYGDWRACLESIRTLRPALPFGRLRALTRGWMMVRRIPDRDGRCSDLRIYSLATGAAYVAVNCAERGRQLASRSVRAGSIPLDALREAAWMTVLSDQVLSAIQVEGESFALPQGVSRGRIDPVQIGTGVPPSRVSTPMRWEVVDGGTQRAAGELPWPDSERPGEAYATHLWRVAEAPFMDGCVPEELPAMPDLEGVEKGLSDTFRDLGRKSCPRQQPDQGLRSR